MSGRVELYRKDKGWKEKILLYVGGGGKCRASDILMAQNNGEANGWRGNIPTFPHSHGTLWLITNCPEKRSDPKRGKDITPSPSTYWQPCSHMTIEDGQKCLNIHFLSPSLIEHAFFKGNFSCQHLIHILVVFSQKSGRETAFPV
jgi:hypothetical protein